FGALLGFAISIIGAGLAALYPTARGIGFILVAIGVLVMVGTLLAAIYFARQRIIKWAQSMGAPQIVLLLGIARHLVFHDSGYWCARMDAFYPTGFCDRRVRNRRRRQGGRRAISVGLQFLSRRRGW